MRSLAFAAALLALASPVVASDWSLAQSELQLAHKEYLIADAQCNHYARRPKACPGKLTDAKAKLTAACQKAVPLSWGDRAREKVIADNCEGQVLPPPPDDHAAKLEAADWEKRKQDLMAASSLATKCSESLDVKSNFVKKMDGDGGPDCRGKGKPRLSLQKRCDENLAWLEQQAKVEDSYKAQTDEQKSWLKDFCASHR